MNITEYINSKTVAEHFKAHFKECDNPDYPVIYAWIVWQNKGKTIAEKHSVWQEIIDTMPNMSIAESLNLHDFLKDYISAEDELIEDFFKDEPKSVYDYKIGVKNERLGAFQYICDEMLLGSFDECRNAVENEHGYDVLTVLITKRIISDGTRGERLLFTADMKNVLKAESVFESKLNSLSEKFDELEFDIPLPFSEGDAVYDISDFGYSVNIGKALTFIEKSANGHSALVQYHSPSGKLRATEIKSALLLDRTE